jgi:hexosaminidase
MGFEGEDMIVLIDLKQPEEFNRVQMNFLKAVESWVFLPTSVKIEISGDGNNFREIAAVEGDNSDRTYLVRSIPFEFEFEKTTARYLKISAHSMKTCPDWHRGYGQPSWIFVDEIILN